MGFNQPEVEFFQRGREGRQFLKREAMGDQEVGDGGGTDPGSEGDPLKSI